MADDGDFVIGPNTSVVNAAVIWDDETGTKVKSSSIKIDPPTGNIETTGDINANGLTMSNEGKTLAMSQSPAQAVGDLIFVLPPNAGTNGQVLTTDGSGVTTWQTPSGGVSKVSSVDNNITVNPSGGTGNVTLTLSKTISDISLINSGSFSGNIYTVSYKNGTSGFTCTTDIYASKVVTSDTHTTITLPSTQGTNGTYLKMVNSSTGQTEWAVVDSSSGVSKVSGSANITVSPTGGTGNVVVTLASALSGIQNISLPNVNIAGNAGVISALNHNVYYTDGTYSRYNYITASAAALTKDVTNHITLPPTQGSDNTYLKMVNSSTGETQWATVTASGDVTGPDTSVPNSVAIWGDEVGEVLTDSPVIISQSGSSGDANRNTTVAITAKGTGLSTLSLNNAVTIGSATTKGNLTLKTHDGSGNVVGVSLSAPVSMSDGDYTVNLPSAKPTAVGQTLIVNNVSSSAGYPLQWGSPTATVGQVDVFTTVGANTWTKNPQSKFIQIILVGGGGGGASGNRGDTDELRAGGSGGSGGSCCETPVLPLTQFRATEVVTVGQGGAGGAAAGGASINGDNGNTSSFGDWYRALGGNGGSITPLPTPGWPNVPQNQGGAGGKGYKKGVDGTAPEWSSGLAGAGGGAGFDSRGGMAGSASWGGLVTASLNYPNFAPKDFSGPIHTMYGGGYPGVSQNGEGWTSANHIITGGSGGSGGMSDSVNNGGNGGRFGGGGGGGSGSTTSGTSTQGKGGDGGAGVVIVYQW